MIEAENLRKSYGNFGLNINMNIPEGRVSGLVGRNGSGKSTAIKLILGLVRADSGSVRVFGTDSAELTPDIRMRIGVALADAGFSNYLTIRAIIKILNKMYDSFEETAFRNSCEQTGLPLDLELRKFSTGMRAKLRVLIAMSHNADLLIMDEPTAGLDVSARRELLGYIRKYLEDNEKRSMLITSHISSDLEQLCDDIYLIHNGEIILHEETDEILNRYAILKLSDEQYREIDKNHILRSQREKYGYSCFADDKAYYRDKYPDIVIENAGIDELILMFGEESESTHRGNTEKRS